MRKREVIEPRKNVERKPMCLTPQQAAMRKRNARMRRFRRGLRAWRAHKVVHVYPGDLIRSGDGMRP